MIFFRLLSFLLFVWLMGFWWFTIQIPKYKIELNGKADAIIVLTGALGRIDAGLQLLSDKYAEHLFISGVGQKTLLEDLSKYLVSFPAKQAVELKSEITLGHFANSTKENAIETAQWIKKNNYKKIILVTSNYHMPRSLYLFRKLMPADVEVIPYAIIKKRGFNNYKLLSIEYHKFLYELLN
ncbi:MAG: YdcF family protein [Pseudomonadota bacterium]